MSQHNYKSLSAFQLKNYLELTNTAKNVDTPFTFGEALYSILRKLPIPEGNCISFIREATDEKFYNAIEAAIKEEKYEQSEENHTWI